MSKKKVAVYSKKVLTISNFLTLIRILATPFLVWGILNKRWVLTILLFVFSAITDLLDGYLARRLKEKTLLGSYLDPLADKIFMISMFAALVYANGTLLLPRWFLIFIITRESLLIVGAIVLFFLKDHIEMRPSILGKLTTFFEVIFIFWYILCSFVGWIPVKTFYVVLGGLTAFSLLSLVHYVVVGLKLILVKK